LENGLAEMVVKRIEDDGELVSTYMLIAAPQSRPNPLCTEAVEHPCAEVEGILVVGEADLGALARQLTLAGLDLQ
jgi:hypothetical protein